MKKVTKTDFDSLPKVHRLNLINSCTGFKSANLIATKSATGKTNLAIISSVIHLGSNPALLGFIVRPKSVPRHTYSNLKQSGFFTVNHVGKSIIKQAHHTSAAYEENISEFEASGLTEEYKEGIDIPFVKESPVQLLCRYINEYEIVENGTTLVVAAIETVYFPENIQHPDGWLQLDLAEVVSINGLDGYCLPSTLDRLEYARPFKEQKSILRSGT